MFLRVQQSRSVFFFFIFCEDTEAVIKMVTKVNEPAHDSYVKNAPCELSFCEIRSHQPTDRRLF